MGAFLTGNSAMHSAGEGRGHWIKTRMWEWTGHLKIREMAFQTRGLAGAKPRPGRDETKANVPEDSLSGGLGRTPR